MPAHQRCVQPDCVVSNDDVQNATTSGVVSAPLWNSEKSKFAGMFTVSDIIHLIQYYYHTASYETAASDVENVRLENLRRKNLSHPLARNLFAHTLSRNRE